MENKILFIRKVSGVLFYQFEKHRKSFIEYAADDISSQYHNAPDHEKILIKLSLEDFVRANINGLLILFIFVEKKTWMSSRTALFCTGEILEKIKNENLIT